MKPARLLVVLVAMVFLGTLIGCTQRAEKSPDVTDTIRKSLDGPGLKDVSVSQDRDKGVVTLGGHVPSDGDKARADSIAKANAAGQVVANEIAVLPPADESDTKTVNADLDKAAQKNLDALLLENRLNKIVRSDVKNGVLTLKGEVNSQSTRARVGKLAATVPNVRQVVNELEVKDQKASSTQ
jgi:hypothetical protein